VVMSWRALIWGLVLIRFVSFRVVNVVPGSFFLFSAVAAVLWGVGQGPWPCFTLLLLPVCPVRSFVVSRMRVLLKFKHSSQVALLSPVLLWRLVSLSSIQCPLLRMKSLASDFIFRSAGSPLCGCVFLWKGVSLPLALCFRLGVVTSYRELPCKVPQNAVVHV